jgi:putative thioredoxin
MTDVTLANFETEVVEASGRLPVLLDFWAPWCEPCKTIGPLLEKLALDYAGRFKLVKINADDEQQLAAAFGIRSIPTCILMHHGQPVDGFTGALPPSQMAAFLDKHLPPAPEVQATPAAQAECSSPPASAQERLATLQEAMQKAPEDDNARFAYLQAALLAGQLEAAQHAFQAVAGKAAGVRRLQSMELLLVALGSEAARIPLPQAKAAFELKTAANPRDFSARYSYAQGLIAHAQYTAALDALLEILMRDKLWDKEGGHEGKARKLYIAVLDLIEPPATVVAQGQIPPEDPTVATYRRRLSSVVLS